jgi:transposase InsO family protein
MSQTPQGSQCRKGNCAHRKLLCNAANQPRLQDEVSHGEAEKGELFAYIEGYYYRAWLHFALGYITPKQAERKVI